MTKISDLTAAGTLDGAEIVPVVQGGTTKRSTVAEMGAVPFTVAAQGPTLKRGANGRVGTFVLNGATPVVVSNTSIAITDAIIISLNTVGGTVGAAPTIQTITAGVGFTVAGTALDTSTMNYCVLKNLA